MKRDVLPVSVLAGMVLLALMPADAAAQRRGWRPYLLGDDLRGISGSIAVQIGGR